MPRVTELVGSCALGLLAAGCFGTPTPLAPGLGGTIGVPHNGVQTEAVELPVSGPGFRRLRPRRPAYFGQPRLVKLLEIATATVDAEHPGTRPLLIGDLSSKYGGKLPGHNSHRTGRDVDLLWYVTTPSGAPVDNPGFVHVGSDGLAKVFGRGGAGRGQYVRLDVPRQWSLVKALLSVPRANIQWIFCSNEIEALLIDYARSKGEDPALIWYAETVLHQPRDSSPHDDHFHLRLACLPEEMARGCLGGGPYWEFLEQVPEAPDLSEDDLLAIGNDDPFLEPAGG